jgi:DNA-binding transcriptional LysR family regulator
LDVELRHLRFVNAVIEAGSFARAAVDLGLSQPGLTKAILRLEQELALSLFERTGRGARPTPYALVLQRFAHVAESGLDKALSEIHELRYNTKNELRIGVTQLLGSCLLPSAIEILLGNTPDARMHVVTRPGNLHRSVIDHEVDLAVLPLTAETRASHFEQHHLFNDRFVVICRPNHPLLASGAAQPKDL